MPKNMRIENATTTAQLPHEFVPGSGEQDQLCDICVDIYRSPRHLAWEQAKRLENAREHAEASGQMLPRETGS